MFRSPWSRVLVCVLIAAGAVAWLTYASVHAYAANSDGATPVLEGLDLGHGNLLLHGWSLSLDSFWTVDVPFYALAVLVVGVTPGLMHFVPAVLVALCALVGVALATREDRRTLPVAGAVIVLTLVAVPFNGAFFLVQGPWHVATTLYCLVAALLLAPARFDWRWWTATALLAVGVNGDLQMLAFGIVPIALAGVVASLRRRAWRAGVVPFSAAAASCALGAAIRAIALAIGTFRVSESHHTVSRQQFVRDVGHFVNWITGIFGLHNGPIVGPGVPAAFAVARGVVFVAVAACGVWALAAMVRGAVVGAPRMASDEQWRIDDMLTLMALAGIAVFFLLTLSDNTNYARYLDPVVIFSSVLAARLIGRVTVASRRARLGTQAALAVLIVAAGVSSVLATRSPVPATQTATLEAYLAHNGLTRGIGDYWAASIVTVDTRGAITVRPVVANRDGKIVPDGRQASVNWFRGTSFEFAVYERSPYGGVNRAALEGTYGPPRNIARVGRYFVVTWPAAVTVTGSPFP